MIDREMLPDHPQDGYEVIRAEASRLAGAPGDIAQRVMVHHAIYRDSAGNHAFPMVALHGALWAAGFFETTGRLGDALRLRYFYDSGERAFRMAMLAGFAEGFRTVNRQVLIDTFTNYCYTKNYATRPEAAGLIHPDLFAALHNMHTATTAGQPLAPQQKRHLYELALQHEQEITVAPGVQAEVEKFDCPILKFLCIKPVVHLDYFPRHTYMFFRNFADKTERVDKAMRSYDLASRQGWAAVEACLHTSRVLPASYWSNSSGIVSQLNRPAV